MSVEAGLRVAPGFKKEDVRYWKKEALAWVDVEVGRGKAPMTYATREPPASEHARPTHMSMASNSKTTFTLSTSEASESYS